jgi:hypothetical protein
MREAASTAALSPRASADTPDTAHSRDAAAVRSRMLPLELYDAEGMDWTVEDRRGPEYGLRLAWWQLTEQAGHRSLRTARFCLLDVAFHW